MSVSFKNDNVEISAIRDRAMFHTFAGNQSFVIKDIGEELAITYSASSFVVSIGTGEAVICGGSTLVEGTNEITLNQNESGYIVIRVDLAQTGDNICQFKAVPSLVQENINDEGYIYDFPLARYTTNGSGVNSFTDQRVVRNNITDDVVKTIDGRTPTNNNINLTDVVKKINGIAPTNNNITIGAGTNVSISNNVISSRNDAYYFSTASSLLDLIISNPNYNTFIKGGGASISDFPIGFYGSSAEIIAIRNSSSSRIMVYWTDYAKTKPMFKRGIVDGAWYDDWTYVGGEPYKLWENSNMEAEFGQIVQTLSEHYRQFRKLLIIFKMGVGLHNYTSLEIPYSTGTTYRVSMMNNPDLFMYRILNFNSNTGQITFYEGVEVKPHSNTSRTNNNLMLPYRIYGM